MNAAPADGVLVGVWSGPRSLSTALMRSWGARPDTEVVDEPFYACYLEASGAEHPGRDEILRRHETDWRAVVASLTAPLPEGTRIRYQKHMAHHLLPGIGRDWLKRVRHAILIRDPAHVLPSLARVVDRPRLQDTGLPQQLELYDWLAHHTGAAPPAIDAADLLERPAPMLRALCEALGVEFHPAMLSWRPGPRASDGVWARHWYGAVERSTRFEPPRRTPRALPAQLQPLLEECEPLYRRLHAQRLEP